MVFGATDLTAGAGGGAVSPVSLLQTEPIVAGSFSLPTEDVSAFEAIVVLVNLTNGTGGHVIVAPTWLDSTSDVIVFGQTMTVFSGSSLRCCYRNFGPFVSVGLIATGVSGPMTITLFGVNTEPRFDGPYTPAASGQVLASGTATANLASYAGPANLYVRNSGGSGSGILILSYEDALATLHEFGGAPVGAAAATDEISQPTQLWIPPNPCTVTPTNRTGCSIVYAVIAA